MIIDGMTDRFSVEIGSYYLNSEGILVYVFGEATLEESGSMVCPPDNDMDSVVNMLGINVVKMISRDDSLDFRGSIFSVTVFKEGHVPVDKSGSSWATTNPPDNIKHRFGQVSHHLGLIEKFMSHMIATYREDMLPAKDVFL